MSYGRGPDGTRTAKRGGGGLVTALRSLVQYHDVTWIASAITEEDRVAAGETLDETARDGSPVQAAPRRARPAGVRLVLQRRLESDAVVRPALSLGAAVRPEARRCVSPRLGRGLRRGQRELRGRGRRGARAHARCCCLLPRLPPLPRAAHGARAAAGRGAHALRAHPVAPARLLAHSCRRTRGARSTTD